MGDRVYNVIGEMGAKHSDTFAPVKTAIRDNTAVEPDVSALNGLQAGFSDFLTNVAGLSASGMLDRKLEAVSQELVNVHIGSPLQFDKKETKAIPEFVQRIANVVREAVERGPPSSAPSPSWFDEICRLYCCRRHL